MKSNLLNSFDDLINYEEENEKLPDEVFFNEFFNTKTLEIKDCVKLFEDFEFNRQNIQNYRVKKLENNNFTNNTTEQSCELFCSNECKENFNRFWKKFNEKINTEDERFKNIMAIAFSSFYYKGINESESNDCNKQKIDFNLNKIN